MNVAEPLDLLVIGSGVAGLSAAVRASTVRQMSVGVLTKAQMEQSNTRFAQGGIAAALGGDPDSTDLHLADTIAAGAGLCDVDAVRVLVEEGPRRVNELIALGATFDRSVDGGLQLAREGGHSLARVVQAGGLATGMEVERALVAAVNETAAQVYESAFALDLVVEDGRCVGVSALIGGEFKTVLAQNVLLASGGAGQLFAVTTNPSIATGDGMAMAMRAGVVVADLEFVQFHPTALHHPSMPRPLLSEALRGHGAILRNTKGERFVDELLPRDEVSRAMTAQMHLLEVDHCFLDATGLENFAERFPTIASDLAEAGLDPATDWLPIAPAAHYFCGGVLTDLDGATSMPGLWAAGEVTTAGIHGANRLASNSLLDGMVFGTRVVEAVDRGECGPTPSGAMRSFLDPEAGQIRGTLLDQSDLGGGGLIEASIAELRSELQQLMTLEAGVLRSEESLCRARVRLNDIAASVPSEVSPAQSELTNLVTVAAGLLDSALARTESRGAHTRIDYPEVDDAFLTRMLLR